MNSSMSGWTSSFPARQIDPNARALLARCRTLTATAPLQWWRARQDDRPVMPLLSILFGFGILIAGQMAAAFDGKVPTAQATIVVLDFELHDLTLSPGILAEQQRTASIAPMLRQILDTEYGFELVAIDSDTQNAADKGSGYLFEHHDVVAELGREVASDWVVVGRVHKASFLFVYFKALVIDTKTERPIANLTVEVKGTQERLTKKGVEALAEQIAAAINDT